MKLVIGGACQGKLAYAKEEYQITDGWIDGRSCEAEELWSCRGIHHLHEYVRRSMLMEETKRQKRDAADSKNCAKTVEEKAHNFTGSEIHRRGEATGKVAHSFVSDAIQIEDQAERFVAELYEKNPEIVLVSNELGCGVVPVERFDRAWRELTGRICVCAAKHSDEVVRVICGIGTKLKCRQE